MWAVNRLLHQPRGRLLRQQEGSVAVSRRRKSRGPWTTLTAEAGPVCLESRELQWQMPLPACAHPPRFLRTTHSAHETRHSRAGRTGPLAADFIWQRPSSPDPGPSSASDSSVENKSINGQFYETLRRQAQFPLPSVDWVPYRSQDKHSEVHETGFLRNVQEVALGSPLCLYLPSPLISHSALEVLADVTGRAAAGEASRRHFVRARWGSARLRQPGTPF